MSNYRQMHGSVKAWIKDAAHEGAGSGPAAGQNPGRLGGAKMFQFAWVYLAAQLLLSAVGVAVFVALILLYVRIWKYTNPQNPRCRCSTDCLPQNSSLGGDAEIAPAQTLVAGQQQSGVDVASAQ